MEVAETTGVIRRVLLKPKMTEVVVTTGAIGRAQLQSNRHHKQINTQLLQAGCPSCRPTNSVRALKGIQRKINEEKLLYSTMQHTYKSHLEHTGLTPALPERLFKQERFSFRLTLLNKV